MKKSAFFILFVVCAGTVWISCNNGENSKKETNVKEFKRYLLIVTYKSKDGLNVDTSMIMERSDSGAYLSALKKYGGHVNDWILAPQLGWEEPISFRLLAESNKDVKELLDPQVLLLVDSLAKEHIERAKYSKYDSTGNIRVVDTAQLP